MQNINLTPPHAGDIRTVNGRTYKGLPGVTMQVLVADALVLAQNGWTGFVPTVYGAIAVGDNGASAVWDNGQGAYVNPLTGTPI